MTRHPAAPPDVAALLGAIEAHGIRCVLVGSVAARAYGARLVPGDLDIVPALDPPNLAQLAALLLEIEASIDGIIGNWTVQESGERKWIPVGETEAQRAARAAGWVPDPADVTTFDFLFQTRHGNFDAPPEICGTFEALHPRAIHARVAGVRVRVAHVDDLLARQIAARMVRDPARVQALRTARESGRLPGD